METILVVEDDPSELRAVAAILRNRGHGVLMAASGAEAEDQFAQEPDIIIADLDMPKEDGFEVLRSAHRALPGVPVILLSGAATVENAVEVMRQGAFDYLSKPVKPERLVQAIRRVSERVQKQPDLICLREPLDQGTGRYGMVGVNASMRRVFEQIRLVAPTRSTVLVTGESGTGKELVARALHQQSPRALGPFVALNCAAIPKDLAESELFGHVRGAFTGATDKRIGKFMAANRGTLLIDEIGEMDLAVQSKLLRAIESRTISPIGSNDEQSIDVRLVAATHRNLRLMVEEGKFREDLYYRLHVVQIDVPSMRQRREDIPFLVGFFLNQLNAENGSNLQEVTPDALDALQSYSWPGNVRQLRNVLEGIVVMSRSQVIELSDLPPEIQLRKTHESEPRFRPGRSLADVERDAIQQGLLLTNGNRQRTAKLLGISVRTLFRKIQEYDLKVRFHLDAPSATQTHSA